MWEHAQTFIERFGIATFVVCWFMFRNDRLIERQLRLLSRVAATLAVIAKTLDLDEEQHKMVAAVDDEEPGR